MSKDTLIDTVSNGKNGERVKHFREDTKLPFRLWNYVRRGHSNYTAYLIMLVNFIVIVYQLSINNVPFLKAIFPSMTSFGITFILMYFPAVLFIGWFDMRRGTYPQDQIVNWDLNPRQRQQYLWINSILKTVKKVDKKVEKLERKLERR